ncbi:response regulator transcription factor [Nocardioides sp. AE5]|uniref:response regulator transcription factor n=1 Tax=Nocardioides sp. AE5 TaxID=2962573 RepID=UPI0028828501|nr:response regulator transcription factor [Nocardioides sp. AE5]MDT0202347.1 response regulator transcription factor [Nocardioides sp. AE5]
MEARHGSSSGLGDTMSGASDGLTIGAIDDHPMVLRGLGAALGDIAPSLRLIEAAASVEEFLTTVTEPVDLVLLDLDLADPAATPESNIARLRDAGIDVLIYTSEERPVPLRRAIAAGASGVLLKIDPIEAVVEAIRQVGRGEVVCSGPLAQALLLDDGVELSPREVEVIQMISDGLKAEAIATALFISEATVREHMRRSFRKFRQAGIAVTNAHDLVRQARGRGYLD